MYEYNENDIRNNGILTFDDAKQEELYYKMLHTLFYCGFYAADNKDCDDLQKARAFISACGLAEDFAKYRYNRSRSTELE